MAATPPPVPETLEELNVRIDLVELRVVRRDMEFRQHQQSLQRRGRALLSPSHWVRPLIGVGSGWLFWRLFKRRPPRRRGKGHGHDHAHHGEGGKPFNPLAGLAALAAFGASSEATAAASSPAAGPAPHAAPKGKPEVALLQMLTMAWGFLPESLRGRLGPQSTQLLLGVLAGVIHGLQLKRKQGKEAGDEAVAQARDAAASVRAGNAAAPASTEASRTTTPAAASD